MVKVNANRKVLLTGASGYLGSHVLDVFLRAGYIVKATVRNQKKADQVAARYTPALHPSSPSLNLLSRLSLIF
jgi:nucleoside-diphosphate-sugar epimerase